MPDSGTDAATSSTTAGSASSTGTDSATSATSTSASTGDVDPCATVQCGAGCVSPGCANAEEGGACETEVCDAAGMCVGESSFDPTTCEESSTTGEDFCDGLFCGDECLPPCPDDSSCEISRCTEDGECVPDSQFDAALECGTNTEGGTEGGSSSSGSGSSGSGSTTSA